MTNTLISCIDCGTTLVVVTQDHHHQECDCGKLIEWDSISEVEVNQSDLEMTDVLTDEQNEYREELESYTWY